FTPLIHSIVKGQLACAEQVLCSNARVDPEPESPPMKGMDHRPLKGPDHIPLNLACQHGSLPIARMLLERNAKLLPDAEGLYPQHMVARASQSPELLLLLKEHGADLDQKDKLYQWTPLFHAASEGCVPCLRTLLECGVDAQVPDEKGLSSMY
ncbi:ankyrin repeat domain-containing protein, partial [Streptomyces javensis]|nr:ankyrin repeat domain-containing protein [Streptomyces javensis]